MNLRSPHRSRRISLTPMIDVVFLLLVFFMLAARFSVEGTISVPLAGNGVIYDGPPRLLDVGADEILLNGVATPTTGLATAIDNLSGSRAETIVLRPRDGADVQRVVDVLEFLTGNGFTSVVLIE